MTPWLGRHAFGEAPTSAIVRASARISSGPLTPPGYPGRHGRPSARRLRAAQCLRIQGGQPRAHGEARRARGRDRRRSRPPAREVERGRRARLPARDRRDARERRDVRGDGRVGSEVRDHARGRFDRRAEGGAGQTLQNGRRLRPPGGPRRRLPQDPHVRRRGRRLRLPGVGGGGAGGGARRVRSGRLERRPDDLLRPPLPRAVPDPRRRGRRARHRTGRVHPLHGQGPLGAPAPRPCRREPVLRGRRQPVGLARRRQSRLRPHLDRRPVGGRSRAGGRRGHGRLGGARPRAHGADPKPPAVARQPTARRLQVAGGGVGGAARQLEAVLFDVDFTLAKPGPLLGPEGYRDAGERFGLVLDPERYAEARAAAVADLEHHPELEHDEAIWVRFTEDIVRGMGGKGARVRAVAEAITEGWLHADNFELYEDALPVLELLRRSRMKIGLVSNTSRDLDAFIRHFALDVDAWISSGTHGKVKPSPTIFRAALALLEVEPEAAAMVGDSLLDDIEGARALGMRALLLDRDARYPEVADALPSLVALPAALGLEGHAA